MQGKSTKAPQNKRRGLRRVECSECGAAIYLTWAQAEKHGLPSCGCGGSFVPDDVELAVALNLTGAPVVVEYEAELSSIARGQAGPGRSLRSGGRKFRDPSDIAFERVEKRRRESALANRLNALRPVAEPMPF